MNDMYYMELSDTKYNILNSCIRLSLTESVQRGYDFSPIQIKNFTDQEGAVSYTLLFYLL